MKKNQGKINFIALAILFVIGATFLFLKKASAESQNTSTGIVGYNAERRIDDIQVDLKNVQAHASDIQAELCIEMPTLEPWNPYATLTIDNIVIQNSEVTLLNAKDPKVMEALNRCYLFTFPLSPNGSASGKGVLKLEKLWIELGRGQLTDKVVTEIKTRLKSVSPEVDFEVVTTTGENGGGASINVTSKPENMSAAEAVSLIQRLSIDEILTNWETTINLK